MLNSMLGQYIEEGLIVYVAFFDLKRHQGTEGKSKSLEVKTGFVVIPLSSHVG